MRLQKVGALVGVGVVTGVLAATLSARDPEPADVNPVDIVTPPSEDQPAPRVPPEPTGSSPSSGPRRETGDADDDGPAGRDGVDQDERSNDDRVRADTKRDLDDDIGPGNDTRDDWDEDEDEGEDDD